MCNIFTAATNTTTTTRCAHTWINLNWDSPLLFSRRRSLCKEGVWSAGENLYQDQELSMRTSLRPPQFKSNPSLYECAWSTHRSQCPADWPPTYTWNTPNSLHVLYRPTHALSYTCMVFPWENYLTHIRIVDKYTVQACVNMYVICVFSAVTWQEMLLDLFPYVLSYQSRLTVVLAMRTFGIAVLTNQSSYTIEPSS